MSTPASPPITGRPWARAGHLARRLPSRARAGIVVLLRVARHLLARMCWLLRGWAGLLAGTLAVLALWLGPLAGARWIVTQATALYRHGVAAVTLWYQTA